MSIEKRLDSLLADFNRSNAPGLVAGVSIGGQPVYRRAFGMANLEAGVANAIATRMPIASITKQFTALSLLLLVDDGRLALDAPVSDYLPDLSEPAGPATVRQLLTHQAGYRCYLDIAFSDGFAMQPAGAGLQRIRRQRSVNFPPGDGQVYSNTGYFLASLIVESLSGQAFEQFLEDRIFKPARLVSTRAVRCDWPVRPGVATPYVPLPGRGGWRTGVNVSEERLGDGCIDATVDDLLTWCGILRQGNALASEAAWAELRNPASLPDGQESHYALGLQIRQYNGLRTLGHGGNVMGASCHLLAAPDLATDVVVLCNQPAAAERIASDLLLEACGSSQITKQEAFAQSAAFSCPDAVLYSEQTGLVLQLTDDEQRFAVRESGAPAMPLRAASDDAPGQAWIDTAVTRRAFSVDSDSVKTSEGGFQATYRPLEAPDEVARVGREASGQYYSFEADATATLIHRQGALALECRGAWGWNHFQLHPAGRDVFFVKHALMPFAATARLVREGGSVIGLDLSTSRTYRLNFQRKDASR